MTISSTVARRMILALLLGIGWSSLAAGGPASKPSGDPHYTPAGFFDMHVCNWPDRPLFFLLLFSTTQFANVTRIDIAYPDGRLLHTFDLGRYRTIQNKNKTEKRVFLNTLDLPPEAPNGWYRARISLKDGTVHTAEDYVVVDLLAHPQIVAPRPEAINVSLPVTLTWQAVPGAQYYRVFIWDLWDDGKLLYESELLTKPELRVPDGALMAGGDYRWRIHARDVNEHAFFGDFNHGSMNDPSHFAIVE
jgi:hypothetical protein